MSRRPRTLMIAPSMPARTGSGYAMRFGIFLEALARVAEVDLVVPVVLDDAEVPGSLPASLGVMTSSFRTHHFNDTRYTLTSLISDPENRVAAFRAYGRPSAAAGISSKVLQYMQALGRERNYDLVHVERTYMAEAGLAAAGPNTSLSLDFDEDDYESMRSQAELRSRSGDRFGAEWWAADADATDALVRKVGSGFRHQWISSAEDQATLRARHPVLDPTLLPNAVEIPDAPKRRDNGATLLFVGSLGYLPNVEGLLWFARSIWPRLRRRAKRPLRLVVAGPNTPPEISALGRLGPVARLLGRKPDIKVLGPVANLRPLYEQATLAIAPLQGGRGTRLKLLEAAAEGVAVMATTDAARGLPLTPPWAWIANGSVDFCDACLVALNDDEERSRRVANGRALVAEQFDRAKTVAALADRFANLLESRSR